MISAAPAARAIASTSVSCQIAHNHRHFRFERFDVRARIANAERVSAKLTTMPRRASPAAINTLRLAASPKSTDSPAAAAWRTRTGSASSAINEIFLLEKARRDWPERP